MNNRSRATLFLMEQLIVILVFAISAAACVKIFVDSHLTATESRDIRNSLLIAESAAECYKASGGDLTETARYMGAGVHNGSDELTIYYDKDCQVADVLNAFYVMELTSSASGDSGALFIGEITVSRFEGKETFSLSVAARR